LVSLCAWAKRCAAASDAENQDNQGGDDANGAAQGGVE
jgi:hypothetical protein